MKKLRDRSTGYQVCNFFANVFFFVGATAACVLAVSVIWGMGDLTRWSGSVAAVSAIGFVVSVIIALSWDEE